MSEFRFPLEVVRRLRSERERETAKRLAEALTQANSADEARDLLEKMDQAGRQEIGRLGGDVGTAHSVAVVLDHLKRHREQVEAQSSEAWDRVRGLFDDFAEALADRRAIDRLREKRKDEWRVEEGRAEQKEQDDESSRRHGGRSLTTEPGDRS